MAFRSGYGTIAQDSPAPSDVDAERAAMLQTSSSKNTFVSRCADHMTVNVTKSWGDVALLGCYLITGLLDSSSIMVWGSFVSMQTGKFTPLVHSSILRNKSNKQHRKHRLPRPRPHRPLRKRPLAPRPHLHRLLLPRKSLLQLFPPPLLALQTMGLGRLLSLPDDVHPRSGITGNPRTGTGQISPSQPLGWILNRTGSLPIRRPDSGIACSAILGSDNLCVDF